MARPTADAGSTVGIAGAGIATAGIATAGIAGAGTRPRAGTARFGAVDGEQAVELDCTTCIVRGSGCPDCVVSFLLGPPSEVPTVDRDQVRALNVLAGSGLVPPLRHRTAGERRPARG